MWRGGVRSGISVAAPFVWRCLTGLTIAPFPHQSRKVTMSDNQERSRSAAASSARMTKKGSPEVGTREAHYRFWELA
jgi:hypothetical protein